MAQTIKTTIRCALSLAVPDWKPCEGTKAGDHASQGRLSIKIYAKETKEKTSASLIHRAAHGEDHLTMPISKYDERLARINSWCTGEYTRAFHRNHTHVFSLSPAIPAQTDSSSLMGGEWTYFTPLRGEKAKAILPFDDEPESTPKCNLPGRSVPKPIYEELRHIALLSPTCLVAASTESLLGQSSAAPLVATAEQHDSMTELTRAIDLDRSSHLWVSWSRMPQLESVVMDLRCYSHDANTAGRYLGKQEIVHRAREMGRHLHLDLLVIVGLYSYSFELTEDEMHALDARVSRGEDRDENELQDSDEVDPWREPDWISVFKHAVRPGGKLVFVDRDIEEEPNLNQYNEASS